MNISYLLLLIGIITIIIAGITAIIEIDIKKIIALSTLRQLGIIILILGLGNPILSFFHLLSHAFFKAILFMCAGMIIHNIKDYQDIRKMGLSKGFIPIVTSVIMVANIRLCGLPFLRGFYSKDLILEMIIMKGINFLIISIMLVGTFLTVAYSCRIRFLVGLNLNKSERCYLINDKDIYILLGIVLLFPASVVGGIKLSWNIFSFSNVIYLPPWIKISIITCIISAVIIIYLYYVEKKIRKTNLINWFISNIWFLPLTYRVLLTSTNLIYGKKFNLFIEIRWLETVLFKKPLSIFDSNRLSKQIDYMSYGYIIQIFEVIFIIFIFYILI